MSFDEAFFEIRYDLELSEDERRSLAARLRASLPVWKVAPGDERDLMADVVGRWCRFLGVRAPTWARRPELRCETSVAMEGGAR
jgi:hypothetical protein